MINYGYQNEKDFILLFNDQCYLDLDKNSRAFINDLFDEEIDSNVKLIAWKNKMNQKTDIFIKYKNHVKGISLKCGNSNSIHCEQVQEFRRYLEKIGIKENIINKYLSYHYGYKKDENDFDDLMEYYDNNNSNNKTSECKTPESPSDKLDDISTTRIYKVFRKLVSLSYERYQKGTYRYNKKEIVKHYLTSQKFRIIDDLVSPTFKPDVYVFDLSPSNNKSLEMYVNAISSVATKNSLIYLTYNDCILRKLVIKKENSQGIDVSKVANSQVEKYNNFDCTIFTEYRSLYEELRDIKDRKIYIFSDFDISFDISRLSQENPSIVWFSTEKNNYGDLNYNNYFYREYPSTYIGYYVEISGIDEIEKFILEKNKSKYKRRTT